MLNEKIEFAEYTCRIKAGMPQRLTYLNITNGLSGVPRALKVIARYALFDLKMSNAGTIDLLNAWCGFHTDTMDETRSVYEDIFKQIENWLPRYMDYLIEADESHRAHVEKMKKELESRKKEWNRFAFFDSGDKNTENKICFWQIIADAYEEGKLQERYLVVEGNSFVGVSGSKDESYRKFMLKTIAIYCAKCTDKKMKIRIGNPELSNWVGSGCLSGKKVNNLLKNILYTDGETCESLFVRETLEGNHNISKIIVSKKWLDTTKARVVSEEEVHLYQGRKNVFVYKDVGCTKELILL